MQKLDVEPNQNQNVLDQEHHDHDKTEWPQANTIDLYALASAAGRLAGNLNNRPGALDDFFNKLKILEQEWYEAEKRYNKLRIENDRLQNQLIHERTRCAIYQKKLKFIQDNQKNFEKLKEVYVSMQAQQALKAEIEEKGCQTYDDLYNESKTSVTKPVDTTNQFTMTKYYGSVIQSNSMVSIKRAELYNAQENLQLLKDMIKKREHTWSVNVQREDTMREEIRSLEQDKEALEKLVRTQKLELKTWKVMRSQDPSEQEDNINNMKRIIGKMSKRLKEYEKFNITKTPATTLSDKEKEVVQALEKVRSSPKKPQMVKPQTPKMGSARSCPTSAPARATRSTKSSLSAIAEKTKTAAASDEYDSDMHELEVLGQIKKSIEEKQAALKEKVQQIINYSQFKHNA